MKFNVRPLSAIHTAGGAGGNGSFATVGTGAGNTNASMKARELYAFLVGSLVQARIRNDLGILQRLSAGVRANLGLDDKMTKKLTEGQVR